MVALTLTPALCVLILQARPPAARAASSRGSTRWFARVTHRYTRRRGRGCCAAALIGAAALRRHGRRHRRPVAHHAGQPRARRGPGLLHRRGDPARRRDARAHRQGRRARSSRRSAPTRPTRTSIAFTGFDFLGGGFRNNAATIFVTQKHWDERNVTAPAAGRRALRQDRGHQGSAGARVQSAADLRPRHRGRLRVLHPEPRRRRRRSACPRSRRQFLAARQRGPAARPARRRCGARPCRSSTSTSTARRRRSSACRSTTSSTRCRRRSAPTTSTTSTSTAAPGRC